MVRRIDATVASSCWGRYWYVRLAVPDEDGGSEKITLASFRTSFKAHSFQKKWNARCGLDFNADVLQGSVDYRQLLHDAAALEKEIMDGTPYNPPPSGGGLGGSTPQPRISDKGLWGVLRRKMELF